MTDPRDLRALLSDAVSDVEPRPDALDALRARARGAPASGRRPWVYGAAGAVLATAATVAAIAVLGGGPGADGDGSTGGRPATPASASASRHTATPDPGGDPAAVPAYFVGRTGRGPVLYREFRAEPVPSDGAAALMAASVRLAVTGTPLDPDYANPWPDGTTLQDVSLGDDVIEVDLGGPVADRPPGLSAGAAQVALQQVVYSAQAGLGERLPVLFLVGGSPADRLLGTAVSGPVSALPEAEVLAQAQITSPAQRATVGSTFQVAGRGSSFEATMLWELRRGDTVVRHGYATAEGWGDRLYPFWFTVKRVPAGDYTLMVSTDDPSGGEEGFGPETDTKAITVR